MIDEEWLNELRFDTLAGKVIGLAGMGGEKVVFLVERPNGDRVVLKTYHHVLGYHIKEIPPFLTETPQYDVQRVNEKLARLIGRNDLDLMVGEYSRLHSSILNIFHEQGVVKGMLAGALLNVDDEMRFFVRPRAWAAGSKNGQPCGQRSWTPKIGSCW